MKNGYIKTAAATPYITVADCNANGNEIIRLIHEMEKEHVKVMTFPELCITPFVIILAIAAGCIVGVVVYKRRKK